MSGTGPPGDENLGPADGDPFGGLPFLDQLMRMMQGLGRGGGDAARQLAHSIANQGVSEPNVDPVDRMAIEQLARVAELQVASATGLELSASGPVRIEAGSRGQWADRTIDDYGALFERLSTALASGLTAPPVVDPADPMEAMLAGLSQVMGPMMLSMTTGSMVGHLAQRSLGGYDLPVPRPADQPLVVNLPNVDSFGDQWSLDTDDLRLWVCLHEVIHHAVFSVPHVRERISSLLEAHAEAFESDPARLEEHFGELDLAAGPDAIAALQERLGDPDTLLGVVRSPRQHDLQPALTAMVAAVTGYVDHVMDMIGTDLIASYSQLTEALRRRRVEADTSDRFVERILGLELDRAQYDRGTAFASGVVERAGERGLHRLLESPENLPTPAEVDAPGLWLARIDLPEEHT